MSKSLWDMYRKVYLAGIYNDRFIMRTVRRFHTKYYDDFKQIIRNETLTRFFVSRIVSFYTAADSVWTVNCSRDDLVRSYGFKGQIEVVDNGTDFNTNIVLKEDILRFENLLKLAKDEAILLFVGQHILQKNVHMLIKSLYELKRMGVNCKTVFIGRGYAENEMKELVSRLHLDKNIIFMGEISDRRLLKAAYSNSDLLLFPSLYDNSSIVLKEASAVGLPALLIRGSNASEGIVDCLNGFLAENDPTLYAQKIVQILDNRLQIKYVGNNAKMSVFKSWEAIIDEVYRFYRDLIKVKSGKRV